MHNQSQLNGEIALDPSPSLGTIWRRHPSAATAPRSLPGRRAEAPDSAPLRDEIDAYARHALSANGFGDANVDGSGQPLRPTSDRLIDQGARVPRPNRLARMAEATLRTVGVVARRMCASWQRQRLARSTYVALSELDTRTLRDLGFDRSEISSVAAEVAGAIESTRAHSAQTVRGLRF